MSSIDELTFEDIETDSTKLVCKPRVDHRQKNLAVSTIDRPDTPVLCPKPPVSALTAKEQRQLTDIGMVDLCEEPNLGWSHWIFFW